MKNHKVVSSLLKRAYHGRSLIGSREVVGYGMNGEAAYHDRIDFPYPAIRYQEVDDKVKALIQKEKGDWKNLSLEDKKTLYRYSFRQTFSEINAPTGEWKTIIGSVLTAVGCALWIYAYMKKFVYGPMPASTSEEAKKAQLERMIQLRVNPIDGIGSKWDYDNNCWKK